MILLAWLVFVFDASGVTICPDGGPPGLLTGTRHHGKDCARRCRIPAIAF
jgi:hypothetical protein